MTPSESIALLIHLREWPRPQRPFNNLIVLISLRDAGEVGLRASALTHLVSRRASTDAATYLANLEKFGLVTRHPSPRQRSTCYWTLSDAGKAHIEHLFTIPAAALPV